MSEMQYDVVPAARVSAYVRLGWESRGPTPRPYGYVTIIWRREGVPKFPEPEREARAP